MGWRDRDWGKFSDDEWKSFVGDRSRLHVTSTVRGATPAIAPALPARKWRPKNGMVALAALISLLVTIAGLKLSLPHAARRLPVRPPQPANVVGIRWSSSDLAPAATAGRICVTDPAHGRICAAYALGEKPADALTRQLAAIGLTVRSSG